MKKAFRKSLKRQSSLGGYFKNSISSSTASSITYNNDDSFETPILWHALAIKFPFVYPKDWYRIEAHWLDQIESFQEQPIDCPGRDGQMNNAITRISQCNESYQLCNSLPRSFIVPKDLKDVILIDTLSTIIKNHRVPVITYCCPIEYRRNFIIRCAAASSEQHKEKVIMTISKAVKPIEVLDMNLLAPGLEKLGRAHKKLHDICRKSDDTPDNQSNTNANFLSRSGKWLNKVSETLKLANKTAHSILTRATVILIDDEDRAWNCVISSLVQLILEPHRRTFEGFESLLSKEWVYLSGGQPMASPSSDHQTKQRESNILFDLFLDCTYQIFLQNLKEFEFTSEYLRYLSLSQQTLTTSLQSPMNGHSTEQQQVQLFNDRTTSLGTLLAQEGSFSRSTYMPANRLKKEPCSINVVQIFDSGKMIMLNPIYMPDKDSPLLRVYDHVANMKLWSSHYIVSVSSDHNTKNSNYDHSNDFLNNNNHLSFAGDNKINHT